MAGRVHLPQRISLGRWSMSEGFLHPYFMRSRGEMATFDPVTKFWCEETGKGTCCGLKDAQYRRMLASNPKPLYSKAWKECLWNWRAFCQSWQMRQFSSPLSQIFCQIRVENGIFPRCKKPFSGEKKKMKGYPVLWIWRKTLLASTTWSATYAKLEVI